MKKMITKFSKMKPTRFFVIGAITLCALQFAFTPAKAQDWTAPATASKVENPVPSNDKSVAEGKTIYTNNCKSCHGVKGKGDGPKSADLEKTPQDFSKEKFQLQTDGALFWKITEGKKPMPTFKKDLTPEQRWQVINYLRKLGKK